LILVRVNAARHCHDVSETIMARSPPRLRCITRLTDYHKSVVQGLGSRHVLSRRPLLVRSRADGA